MGQPSKHTLHVQQLFVRHQTQLKAFVLALCPDFSLAEDVLHDVFLVVTEKAQEFEEGTNFLAWARTIARYKICNATRRSARPCVSVETLESLAAACPDDWASGDRVAALADCIDGLAPKSREIIQLRYLHEHPPAEIAKLLSRTVNSIGVTLSKARGILRECVDRELAREGT